MRGTIAALLLGCLLVLSADAYMTHRAERGEYIIASIPDDRLTEQLNTAGSLGWRISSARRAQVKGGEFAYELIMWRHVDR